VEAFPNSFLGLMLSPDLRASPGRGARSDAYYQRLIANGSLPELLRYLIPRRNLRVDLNEFENHDDRAGIVCALTALCVANNTFTAVGDEDGWIVLPPKEFIQTDLWALLEQNAEDHTGGLIVAGS
ncbi:MAG: hypothetical protein KDA77_23300, partial [Planctomycetaceae bacterium]|nr:hypothetical protein [Planctomycetaceae bacterium]